jgi:hypothetical protein
MASKPGEITEEEVAIIVVQIASQQPNSIASYERIRQELPRRYKLTAADLAVSATRPNEAVWEQKIRNIKSHFGSPGNFIYEGYLDHVPGVGYRVTDRGRKIAQRYAA